MNYEEERERYERRQRIERAQPAITGPMKEAIIDGSLERSSAGAAVHCWYQKPRAAPILVLAGTIGRGKTVAAASLIAEVGGRYITAEPLLKLATNSYSEVAERYRVLSESTPVVVDDVGREERDDRFGIVLLNFLDGRRGGRHRTLLITNLTQEQFLVRYPDERLRSRLRESARWALDLGPDLRQEHRGDSR